MTPLMPLNMRAGVHRRGVARTVGLILVAVVIIGLFLYLTLGTGVGRPDESNRVNHPAGFSAVMPADWESVTLLGSADGKSLDRILASPHKSEGRPVSISYAARNAPDEAELVGGGYEQLVIAGREAFHKQIEKKDRVDLYVIENAGHWFDVTVTRHLGDYNDAVWRAYVTSVRPEKLAASRPVFPLIAGPTTATSQGS